MWQNTFIYFDAKCTAWTQGQKIPTERIIWAWGLSTELQLYICWEGAD